MSSNSVCNHTRDQTTPATRSSDFVNHSYDYRPNWTPLSPITIIYYYFIIIFNYNDNNYIRSRPMCAILGFNITICPHSDTARITMMTDVS